ncbi:hypothetical protein JW835_09270 [bacterium]|nr:hypothetical protein [bacterium]
MFTLGYDKTRKCLVGVYKGMYSEEILTVCAAKTRSAIMRHPCNRFVMDMRQADMIPERLDFKKWYKVFYEAGLDTSWKKVILLSNDNYKEIKENQKVRDCQDMDVFGDIKEAIQWMLS